MIIMTIIKCKMCGGDIELSSDQTFGTCEYCGSKMTLPKVDDEQRAAAFNRGNHFRRIGEFDKALAVYEHIVQEDNADAEAHWCSALCRFGIEYVKDPASGKYVPTCHRASFDSFLEDVDYRAAVAHADAAVRRQYETDGAKIEAVRRSVLATSQNEKPYDVFICYKETDDKGRRTVDSTLAQDIYYQLTEQGRRVFFSRITLEDKAGTEFEPYIFAALCSAKVMVVVGTKPEYFGAAWVKNEWSRFLALMKRDKSKLLLPCYRDMDPYDLPEQLAILQSYDMGKIGFIQDLIRGVAKVLDTDRHAVPAKRAAATQSEGGANIDALLKRGKIALEDQDWRRADEFFEQVLNMDAECAEAYLGKELAEEKCSSLDAFIQKKQKRPGNLGVEKRSACPEDKARIDAAMKKNVIPGQLEKEELLSLAFQGFDRSYPSRAAACQRHLEQTRQYFQKDKTLKRVLQYGSEELIQQLKSAQDTILRSLQGYVDEENQRDKEAVQRIRAEYAVYLEHAEEEAGIIHRAVYTQAERSYEEACAAQARAKTPLEYREAIELLRKLNGYRDSLDREAQCAAARDRLEDEEQVERARQERLKKEREIKISIAIGAVFLAAVAAFFLVRYTVILPNRYQRAESLLESGSYEDAIAAFEALGNYHNAAERILEARYAEAEALYGAGRYEEAIERFEALIARFESFNDYDEAEARLTKVYYAEAEALESAGDLDAAAIAFGKAANYADAKERSMELWDKAAFQDTISAGFLHVVGLKSDGAVIAAGNRAGSSVDDWRDIMAVSAGADFTVGLTPAHTVVATGDNDDGQCKVDSWSDIVAISASKSSIGTHTVGLKSNGTVVAVGDNYSGICDVEDWRDIVAIAAGDMHTVGLKTDGTVVAVGSNSAQQCNVDSWTDIVAIAAGGAQTIGLKSDGSVIAAGGRVSVRGDIDSWTDIAAIAAGDDHTVGLKSDGTVVAVGSNFRSQCDVDTWTDIVAISAGFDCTMGLRSDGTVVVTGAVGIGTRGQSDVADWTGIKLPVRSS